MSAACNGPIRWTEGVELHPFRFKKDVVADEQRFLEDIESKAGSMAVDVESFDAMVSEVLVEMFVKTERAADFMARILLVDAHLGAKMTPVEVGGTEEVVMGEQDRVNSCQRGVEGGGAIDPDVALTRFDPIGGMFVPECRLGVEPGHLLIDRGGHHLKSGRTFLCGYESLFRSSAKRAGVWMEAHHVKSADKTNILFVFHRDTS